MKIIILSIILLCFKTLSVNAQSYGNPYRPVNGGVGSAKNDKLYLKIIQLIDVDTKTPLTHHNFTVTKAGMPIGPSKTDINGFGKIIMRNSNYYNKVEIDLNPNYEMPAQSTAFRNFVAYKTVDLNDISFPSKKEIVDTVKVYVKKIK